MTLHMMYFTIMATITSLTQFTIVKYAHCNHPAVTIRPCKGSLVYGDTIEIPTWHTQGSQNMTYSPKNYSLEANNTTSSCKDGSSPTDRVTTVSVSKYAAFHNESSLDSKVIQLFLPLFLDMGYLSVGDRGKHAVYYFTDEYCIDSTSGSGNDLVASFKICAVAPTRPVLIKCCPMGTSRNLDRECEASKFDSVWHPGYLEAESLAQIPLHKANPVYQYKELNCSIKDKWIEDSCTAEFHPLTNSRMTFVTPFRSWGYLDDQREFCFDRAFMEDGSLQKAVLICHSTAQRVVSKKAVSPRYILISSMFIGAFFHLLTSAVYVITWKRQNLHGKTICCFALTLLFKDLLLAIAHLLNLLKVGIRTLPCVLNGVAAHYFVICSFAWLLVINLDLLWTFGSTHSKNSSGRKRFWVYNVVGWGLPLLLIGLSIAMNWIFPCITSRIPVPEYGIRNCYITPKSRALYVYPIVILLFTIGAAIGIVTLVIICKARQNGKKLRSNRDTQSSTQTFVLILKLVTIMGLSWIFDIIPWAAMPYYESTYFVWRMFDSYNALTSIIIFGIFVCKKSTIDNLGLVLHKQ